MWSINCIYRNNRNKKLTKNIKVEQKEKEVKKKKKKKAQKELGMKYEGGREGRLNVSLSKKEWRKTISERVKEIQWLTYIEVKKKTKKTKKNYGVAMLLSRGKVFAWGMRCCQPNRRVCWRVQSFGEHRLLITNRKYIYTYIFVYRYTNKRIYLDKTLFPFGCCTNKRKKELTGGKWNCIRLMLPYYCRSEWIYLLFSYFV